MTSLLADSRVQRLLLANLAGSIGTGVTVLAVPWLLVQQPGGAQLYGYTMLVTTAVLFLFIPYYGSWLDRHSRKSILLAGEAFGFVATLTMATVALLSERLETWQLLATYFAGMTYYTLHYPAKFAFVQQLVDRQHYHSLTGMIEIQGQAASMASGALASVLLGKIALSTILLFDASTYLGSFLLQATIPYHASHLVAQGHERARVGAWRSMGEGLHWLWERPRLLIFFLSTYVPFICLMVANYLFPVYVTRVLGATARVFGTGEMAFALGALSAGFVMPHLASRHGADRTIVVTMALFVFALILLVVLHANPVYYLALVLLGFGNAGSRVARAAVVLTLVPNRVIGRVQLAFAAFDRTLRLVLTFGCTLLVTHASAASGFALLAITAAVAFWGMWTTRGAIRAVPQPTQLAA